MHWSYIWDCPYDAEGWRAFVNEQPGKVALQIVWEDKVQGCTRCKLHETRNKIVFGVGNTEQPDIAFVGIGPGETEDRVGLPFIGRAGELLTDMVKAMGYARGDVFVCNVVGCRPPGNRDPEADELLACSPVWTSQLVAVRPKVIVTLGAVPGNVLLGTKGQHVGDMRRKWGLWRSIPVQATYHPAGLLRQEHLKKSCWEDLQKVLARLKGEQNQDSGPLFRGSK